MLNIFIAAILVFSVSLSQAFADLTQGDIVYAQSTTGKNLVGEVNGFFENDTVVVKWLTSEGKKANKNLSYWKSTHLFKLVKQYEKFREKQTVYRVTKSGHYLVGVIQKLFENGIAEVKWRTSNGKSVYWKPTYWHTSFLVRQISCKSELNTGRLTVGEMVYGNSKTHLVGVILRIFEDGIAEIKWHLSNGKKIYWPPSYWHTTYLHKMVSEKSSVQTSAQEEEECPHRKKKSWLKRIFGFKKKEPAQITTTETVLYAPEQTLSSASTSDTDLQTIPPSRLYPDLTEVPSLPPDETIYPPLPSAPPLEDSEDIEATVIADEEDHECPICLNQFQDKTTNITRTPCGHEFHFDCLQEWIMTNPGATCPACRGVFIKKRQ